MKRFGTILLTSTCSLGAGYFFGYRHQEVNNKQLLPSSPHQHSPIPPPHTDHNSPIPIKLPPSSSQLIQQSDPLPSSSSLPQDETTSQQKENPVSNSTTTPQIEQLKEDDESSKAPLEEQVKNLQDQIYEYLQLENHDSIRWPKYNIQFLSDDTEENRQATVKLFKTFDGFGIPTHAGAIHLFSHFISVSDSRMKIPLYVAWTIPHLDEAMTATANRKFSHFGKGKFYDNFNSFNPDNNDYLGSGYSRGHLVNCGDFNYFDQQSMNDTHLLIHNIVPQNFKNNAGYWLRMERFTRSLAYDFNSVHVIAGGAMIPEMFERKEVNGRLQAPKGSLKHLIVGNNHVAVPTHLFRIIIAEKQVGDNQPMMEYYAQAFLVPNTEIEKTDELTKYSISLKELESITGLRFLDKLEKSGNMLPLCRPPPSSPQMKEEISTITDLDTTVTTSKDNVITTTLSTTTNDPAADIKPVDLAITNSSIGGAADQQQQQQEQTNDTLGKYGCNCLAMFPPWQDLDIQELLWKKNITESDIEEKWNQLVETTNWIPSKDIIERKKEKLDEIKSNTAPATLINN